MSVLAVDQSSTPNHPFQCAICNKSFTRKENLKRHAAVHFPEGSGNNYLCDLCPATFSRLDLRQRHLRRKHPDSDLYQVSCREQRRRRERQVQRNVYGQEIRSPFSEFSNSPTDTQNDWDTSLDGQDLEIEDGSQHSPAEDHSASRHSVPPPENASLLLRSFTNDSDRAWTLSALQHKIGQRLFFEHVSGFMPIFHLPTFDVSWLPEHLVMSMCCLAYHHGQDPEDNQPGSGDTLARRCFARALTSINSAQRGHEDADHSLFMIQSLLILQIYAILYAGGEQSAAGFEIHHRMVAISRSGGLMSAPSVQPAQTEDLHSLWEQFARAETLKRTVLVTHQVDALWYQFLSIPRSLSHLEIKHDLPCSTQLWEAPTAEQWAHRQLTASGSSQSVLYGEAVRRFLAPDGAVEMLPDFDACGTINIAQFLLSSARELSGWATMTGRLSFERLHPLRSSLLALEPFARTVPADSSLALSHCCQATWEMAMIELLVWWPSHTCGIVLASMDAFVEHATSVAACSEFLFDTDTAETIKPHIDWFLKYLASDPGLHSEPLWVLLYAYKAFLIAWQLLPQHLPEAMQIVGIGTGDQKGAVSWARNALQRRRRHRLVRKMDESLGILEQHLEE